MADLIILRLHPGQQISPADFRAYLQGLTITAYDLSYANPLGEPPPNHPPCVPSTVLRCEEETSSSD